MPREAIIYGRIEGIAWRPSRLRDLQDRNAAVLADLPEVDRPPVLVRGMFALPVVVHQQQVIHFGGSFADPPDPATWVAKFEHLLSQLYWLTATVHLEREDQPERIWRWRPTDAALARLAEPDPPPIRDWQRAESVGGTLPP